MLLNELLNTPITIGGKTVILVDDHIGDDNLSAEEIEDLIEIEAPDSRSPGFNVSEKALFAIRTSHPDVPTYGLWQTLYHSGLLEGHEYVFVPFDAMSGRFARLENGDSGWVLQRSGIVTGGELTEEFGVGVDRAHELDIDPSQLALPDDEALLLREHQARVAKLARKRYLATALVCLAIVVSAVITEGVLVLKHRSVMLEMNALKEEQLELDQQIADLTRTRLARQPDYSTPISRLFKLQTLDPELVTGSGSSFQKGIVTLLSRESMPLVRTMEWVSPGIHQSGDIIVPIPANGGMHEDS